MGPRQDCAVCLDQQPTAAHLSARLSAQLVILFDGESSTRQGGLRPGSSFFMLGRGLSCVCTLELSTMICHQVLT